MYQRIITLTTATALLAAPTAFLLASPAQADGPERQAHGSVGGARYEISAEREDGRYEVDADLDGVRAGSTWKMVVRHDGKKVSTQTARAVRDDGRHDADFRSVHRVDTRGGDTFKVTISRVGGTPKVSRTLSFR